MASFNNFVKKTPNYLQKFYYDLIPFERRYGSEFLNTYNLFNDCYYICKMPILYNDKNKYFILDHLDAYYKIGGYLNMFCNSTLCTLGNQKCNLVNIKDEL